VGQKKEALLNIAHGLAVRGEWYMHGNSQRDPFLIVKMVGRNGIEKEGLCLARITPQLRWFLSVVELRSNPLTAATFDTAQVEAPNTK
jgi:hypothetical protein